MLYNPYVLQKLVRGRQEDELRRGQEARLAREAGAARRRKARGREIPQRDEPADSPPGVPAPGRAQPANTGPRTPRPVFTSIALAMLLMAVFTLSWASAPLFVWGARGVPIVLAAAALTIFLFIDATRLLIRTRDAPRVTSASDHVQGVRVRRLFGITFGLEGLFIAAVSTVLSLADLGDFIPPAVALVVAVHFYPFAPIFRRRVDYFFASGLAVASLIGLVVMVTRPGSALTVIVFVSLAAAMTTALYGLYFARQHRLLGA